MHIGGRNMKNAKEVMKNYKGKERANNDEFEIMDEFVENFNNGDYSIELTEFTDWLNAAGKATAEPVDKKVAEALRQFRESNEFAYSTLAYARYKKGWNEALQTMLDWFYMYAPKLDAFNEEGLEAVTALITQLKWVFKMK